MTDSILSIGRDGNFGVDQAISGSQRWTGLARFAERHAVLNVFLLGLTAVCRFPTLRHARNVFSSNNYRPWDLSALPDDHGAIDW